MAFWFEIANADQLLTPTLLFYPKRIESNIQQMLKIAGAADRLRPHVKTHKCREIVKMQLARGIINYKCATLSEARMVAEAGATSILLAYPLIGPAQKQFLRLTEIFPETTFAVLIDHTDHLNAWTSLGGKVNLFIDLDAGTHRTGIPFEKAEVLFHEIQKSQHRFLGWHCYDGHIHQSDPQEREQATEEAYSQLTSLVKRTDTHQHQLICGSSITFPIHAQHPQRHLAPGTTLLWDHGYSSKFPDLKFEIAATVLTRIISKPGAGLLCLDLGYKAVASEMAGSPVYFPQLPDAKITNHSEEHLVIKTEQADDWTIGRALYAFPWHICPTVALHEKAGVVNNREVTDYWQIEARNRIYTL